MTYFSLDEFLLGEELVPVTVKIDSEEALFLAGAPSVQFTPSPDPFSTPRKAPHRGMSERNVLPRGTSVTLPWYVGLSTHERGLTQILQLPRHFSRQTLRDLNATKFRLGDARYKQLNLRRISPYFFDLAVAYSTVMDEVGDAFEDDDFDEEAEDLRAQLGRLMRTLLQAFERRYRMWLVKAFSPVPNEDDAKSAEAQLTNVEAGLFRGARNAMRMLNLWERNRISEGETERAEVVVRRTGFREDLPDDVQREEEEEEGEGRSRLTGIKRGRQKRQPRKKLARSVGFFEYTEEETTQMQIEMEGGQVQDEDGDVSMREDEAILGQTEELDPELSSDDEEELGPPRKRRKKEST